MKLATRFGQPTRGVRNEEAKAIEPEPKKRKKRKTKKS